MCGINAIFILDKRHRTVDSVYEMVSGMNSCLVHRGPDGDGIYIDSKVSFGLGHRRLSIIDLSSAGSQPLKSEDSVICFNGEIYNYRKLRFELEKRGIKFLTNSDTEVLLKGIDDEGVRFLDKVDGQFAFTYCNEKTGYKLIARDKFGEKPLYYTLNANLLAVASELSALKKLDLNFSISKAAIEQFLMFQYFPDNSSIYSQVRKLPPGHYIEIIEGSVSKEKRYFQVEESTLHVEVSETRSIDEYAEQVLTNLIKSLEIRFEASDVEVGAFLSGGIDSSLVVSILTKELSKSVKTFSIGFQDDPNSEHLIARNISQVLGTEHFEKNISLDIDYFIQQVLHLMDEPHGDFSIYPTYELANFARKEVKVAVSGDGGDELFYGYGRYLNAINFKTSELGERYYSDQILTARLEDLLELFKGVELETLDLLSGLRNEVNFIADKYGVSKSLRFTDINNYLPGAVLHKVDRMSMLNSLEVRTPFLENNLLKVAFSIPDHFLHNEIKGKYILRYLLQKYLRSDVTKLPKKGFGFPSAGWGQKKIYEKLNLISNEKNASIFTFISHDRYQNFVESISRNRNLYNPMLNWNIIILYHWLKSHE